MSELLAGFGTVGSWCPSTDFKETMSSLSNGDCSSSLKAEVMFYDPNQ